MQKSKSKLQKISNKVKRKKALYNFFKSNITSTVLFFNIKTDVNSNQINYNILVMKLPKILDFSKYILEKFDFSTEYKLY